MKKSEITDTTEERIEILHTIVVCRKCLIFKIGEEKIEVAIKFENRNSEKWLTFITIDNGAGVNDGEEVADRSGFFTGLYRVIYSYIKKIFPDMEEALVKTTADIIDNKIKEVIEDNHIYTIT